MMQLPGVQDGAASDSWPSSDASATPPSAAEPPSVEPAVSLHVAIGVCPAEHTSAVGQLVTWVSVLRQALPKLLHWHDAGPLQQVEYVFVPQLLGPAVSKPQRHCCALTVQP